MEKHLYLQSIPSHIKAMPLSEAEEHDACYLTSDAKSVFKTFESIENYVKEYEYLSSFKCEHFAFPRQLVFLKGKLVGYLMNYFPGQTLKEVSRDIEIVPFCDALKKVEDELDHIISARNLQINDANLSNIIYTPNKELKVIDTDLYEPNTFAYDLLFENRKEFNQDIKNFLVNGTVDLSLFPEQFRNYYFQCFSKGSMPMDMFIMILKRQLEEMSKTDINTFSQMDNSLALIRKK